MAHRLTAIDLPGAGAPRHEGQDALAGLEAAAFGRDMQTSIHAAEQIASMTPHEAQFQALTRLIDAPNPLVAQIAIKRLEGYGDAASEPLIAALGRSRPMIQISLTCALERLGSRAAVGPLMQVLKTAEYPSLRYTIIHALGTLGNPAAIDLIRSFAGDPDDHVRRRVEIALSRLATHTKE